MELRVLQYFLNLQCGVDNYDIMSAKEKETAAKQTFTFWYGLTNSYKLKGLKINYEKTHFNIQKIY